eukprot:c25111_g1_i1 orf=225-2951(+)
MPLDIAAASASASPDPPALTPPAAAVTDEEPPPPQPAAPGKKTRHWEAWTHREEENFFIALRQFGKNFEKIRSRIQSKNKDQVRHYYYRLIKRMNKLLGPNFVLDAKNSKDVNSAMLCWWSLLEKHSCPASKLHLKPRRFKTFVTALEHQLLKDRKRLLKKQAPQAHLLVTSPVILELVSGKPNPGGPEPVGIIPTGESCPQKASLGVGSTSKRKTEPRNTRNKAESSRPPRQRKKATDGNISAAAYKKWEKAASAGVTLVAEAAEQLEREAISEQLEQGEPSQKQMKQSSTLASDILLAADKRTHLAATEVESEGYKAGNVNGVVKLKLQLFPIDNFTRTSMEKDGLCPHLELTLKSRKTISSVIQHLNQKWGRPSIASSELRLFPFNMQWKKFPACQSWSSTDMLISAEDVFTTLGSPEVFRLKYGWMPYRVLQSSNAELQQLPFSTGARHEADAQENLQNDSSSHAIHQSVGSLSLLSNVPSSRVPISETENVSGGDSYKNLCRKPHSGYFPLDENLQQQESCCTTFEYQLMTPKIVSGQPFNVTNCTQMGRSLAYAASTSGKITSAPLVGLGEASCGIGDNAILFGRSNPKGQEGFDQSSMLYEESNDGFAQRLWGGEGATSNGNFLPIEMDWARSLTNISISELLNDASHAEHILLGAAQAHLPIQSLDSFDAAVAAQGANLPTGLNGSVHLSQTSVLDGEETCDGFSFQKHVSIKRETGLLTCVLDHSGCQNIPKVSTGLDVAVSDFGSLEAWKQSFNEPDIQSQDLKADSAPQSTQEIMEGIDGKQFLSQDLHWADSLGSLDLGMPVAACVQGQDLFFSGDLSLGSLGGYGLDVFQCCSSQGDGHKVLSSSAFQVQSTCNLPAVSQKGICSGSLQESTTIETGGASPADVIHGQQSSGLCN